MEIMVKTAIQRVAREMKCPNCGKENGIIVKERRGEKGPLSYFCFECEKDIPLPLKNDKWRKACSTEEFTEELTKVVLDIVAWNNDPKPSEVRNILKAWLKRPHAEKE